MNITFNQFNKTKYPYLDDSYIDNYIPVAYGKIASVKLTPINSNYDTDNGNVAAVYRMPDGMTNYGTVYVKVDDTWVAATVSSVDYDTGLITISNGRSESGSTYECKLTDCYGYMFDGHCYPRQALQHWYATYGNIQYTDSNFNKTEWVAALDNSRFQADFGLLLDDYSKDEDSDNTYDLDYFNKVVYNISTFGGKMYCRVDYDLSGKITATLKDYDRTASDTIASADIYDNNTLSASTTKDSAFTSIIEKYYHNTVDNNYLSLEDNTYEKYVKQNYRIMQSKTDISYLINEADAKARAAELALEYKHIPVEFTINVRERYTTRLYDVVTVALMPDNLDSSMRQYAGNKDCLVTGVAPLPDSGYTTLTLQIIPDRTASAQQISVRNSAYTTAAREKSSTQIITDNLKTQITDNLLLTGSLSLISINLNATTAGVVSDFSKATGTFNVKYSGTDITGNGPVYAVVSQTGCTGTIDSATGVYAVSALSADVGILLLKATYKEQEIETSFTVTKAYTGATGSPGANGTNGTRTASIEMYKWASSAPTSFPSGTSTYTWATGAFTNPATTNGWSQTISAGTAGQILYRVRAVYADSLTTTTSSITWPTSPILETVSNYATDGSDGVDGVNGTRTAILEVYKWASSAPTTFPSGTSTYTWATGVFTAPTTANGWSINPGASTAGYTLYACHVKYADALTTTTSTVTWNTSTAYAVGAAGTNGINTATVHLYQQAASAPAVPTNTLTYTFATGMLSGTINNGWSTAIPAASTTPTYMILAVPAANPATDTITTAEWSTPVIYTKTGSNGTSITISSQSVTYQSGTSGTTAPTGTWTTTVPTVAQGHYLWTKTVVTYSDASSTTAYSTSYIAIDGVDSTAITVSDPASTTPESGMAYNNTYYGINSGIWYKWAWSSTTTGYWTQVSADTPPTPAVRYSFDEMPDLPDASGQTNDIDDVAWYSQCTITTNSDGTKTVTASGSDPIIAILNPNVQGKIIIADVTVPYGVTFDSAGYIVYGKSAYDFSLPTSIHSITGKSLSVGKNRIAFLCPTNASYSYAYLRLDIVASPGNTYIINDIYIGDGTTSQPIIDNVSGACNSTAQSGVVSCTGVSGKACQFLGYRAISLDLSAYANVQSWWVSAWINIPSASFVDYKEVFTGSSDSYRKLWWFLSTSGFAMSLLKTSQQNITIPVSSISDSWHCITSQVIVNSSTETIMKLYLDGVLYDSLTLADDYTDLAFSTVYLGGLSLTSDVVSGFIDDFQFGVGEITASQVLGLYLHRASAAKLYTLADYNYDNSVSSWEITSSAASFSKSRSGVVTPASVTLSAKAIIASVATAYSGRFIIYTSTDGTTFTSVYTSSADESSHAYSPASNIASFRVELYKAGGTSTLVATKDYSVPYNASVKPQYLGLGLLADVSGLTTKAYTSATITDAGVITPGSPVSAVIQGDWMINYTAGTYRA